LLKTATIAPETVTKCRCIWQQVVAIFGDYACGRC